MTMTDTMTEDWADDPTPVNEDDMAASILVNTILGSIGSGTRDDRERTYAGLHVNGFVRSGGYRRDRSAWIAQVTDHILDRAEAMNRNITAMTELIGAEILESALAQKVYVRGGLRDLIPAHVQVDEETLDFAYRVLRYRIMLARFAERGNRVHAVFESGVRENPRNRCILLFDEDEQKQAWRSITSQKHERKTDEGKPYSFWTTTAITSVSKTSCGFATVREMYRESGRNGARWTTPLRITTRPQAEHTITSTFRKLPECSSWFDFLPESLSEHPVISHWGGDQDISQHPLLPMMVTASTAAEFTATAFGKTRVRRDLVKAVAQSPLNRIVYARALRGLVPTEWIVEFLAYDPQSNSRRSMSPTVGAGVLRVMAKHMKPTAIHRVLRTFDPHSIDFYDLVRMKSFLSDIEEQDWYQCRTVGDVHDAVSDAMNLKSLGNLDQYERALGCSPNGFDMALHGAYTDGGKRIDVATDVETLREWGRTMRHCILSYAGRLPSPHALLLGVYEGARLLGNIELVFDDLTGEWHCLQFQGKRNAPVPHELYKDVMTTIDHITRECAQQAQPA